jgi:hypothetical protein
MPGARRLLMLKAIAMRWSARQAVGAGAGRAGKNLDPVAPEPYRDAERAQVSRRTPRAGRIP